MQKTNLTVYSETVVFYESEAKPEKAETAMTNSVELTFQILSLNERQQYTPFRFGGVPYMDLENKPARLWKVFAKKALSGYGECKTASELKEQLNSQLAGFLAKLDKEDPVAASLSHDLKNKTLQDIRSKYFTGMNGDGLHPVLLDLKKIFDNEVFIDAMINHEQEEAVRNMASMLEIKAVNRDLLMRVLGNGAKDTSEISYHVMDIGDLPDMLFQTCLPGSNVEGARIQINVRNNVHYTAVDLLVTNEGVKAVVMDAARTNEVSEIVVMLKEAGVVDIYVVGLLDFIQYDRTNCAYFASEVLTLAAKEPDFFGMINELPAEKSEGVVKILWSDMPFSYVRNASSLSFFRDYFKKHSLEEETYKDKGTYPDYMKSFYVKKQIKGVEKEVNGRIEFRIEKMKRKVKELPFDEIAKAMVSYPIEPMARGEMSLR